MIRFYALSDDRSHFKDFAVDQSPSGSVGGGPEQLHVINIRAAGTFHGVSGMTVSGMFFDPTDASHTIHLENDGVLSPMNDGNLRATITNNYFNFVKAGLTAAVVTVATLLHREPELVDHVDRLLDVLRQLPPRSAAGHFSHMGLRRFR